VPGPAGPLAQILRVDNEPARPNMTVAFEGVCTKGTHCVDGVVDPSFVEGPKLAVLSNCGGEAPVCYTDRVAVGDTHGNWRRTIRIGSPGAGPGTPYVLRVDCITPEGLAELNKLGDATVGVPLRTFNEHFSCDVLAKVDVQRP
jgi:hypothetical protein